MELEYDGLPASLQATAQQVADLHHLRERIIDKRQRLREKTPDHIGVDHLLATVNAQFEDAMAVLCFECESHGADAPEIMDKNTVRISIPVVIDENAVGPFKYGHPYTFDFVATNVQQERNNRRKSDNERHRVQVSVYPEVAEALGRLKLI